MYGHEIIFKLQPDFDTEDIPYVKSFIKYLTELIEVAEKKEKDRIEYLGKKSTETPKKIRTKNIKKVTIKIPEIIPE